MFGSSSQFRAVEGSVDAARWPAASDVTLYAQ